MMLFQYGTNLLSCYITVPLVGYPAIGVKLDTSAKRLTYGWQVQSPYLPSRGRCLGHTETWLGAKHSHTSLSNEPWVHSSLAGLLGFAFDLALAVRSAFALALRFASCRALLFLFLSCLVGKGTHLLRSLAMVRLWRSVKYRMV